MPPRCCVCRRGVVPPPAPRTPTLCLAACLRELTGHRSLTTLSYNSSPAQRKSDEDSRSPPPSYDYVLMGNEPVTAVPVESQDKSLPGGEGASGIYGDPGDASGSTAPKGASSASAAGGEHSVSKAPPGLADLEGSKVAGGLGAGTAVAVGAAAATAAVAATTVAATRARQSDASLPLPQVRARAGGGRAGRRATGAGEACDERRPYAVYPLCGLCWPVPWQS